MNLIRKSILNTGAIKSKTITKLYDRLMIRGFKLGNDKDISCTPTMLSTMLTQYCKNYCSKIFGETGAKKLVYRCGCFKN